MIIFHNSKFKPGPNCVQHMEQARRSGVMDLQALPESCIANVISLTTPRDACRMALVSKGFKSALDFDAVWDRFLPPETNEILSQYSGAAVDTKSKKELYFTVCDKPILIDDGKMSLSVDKGSAKKCYMIAARRLRIDWGRPWKQWKSLPESRFKEAAKLRDLRWLEIRGRIETRMLSPWTMYKAYLVYRFEHFELLRRPLKVTVNERAYGFDYECSKLEQIIAGIKHTVFLAPKSLIERTLETETNMRRYLEILESRFPNEGRGDGWREIELGEFYCRGDEDGELEMICCELMTNLRKPLLRGHGFHDQRGGLLVQGIEVRPERE